MINDLNIGSYVYISKSCYFLPFFLSRFGGALTALSLWHGVLNSNTNGTLRTSTYNSMSDNEYGIGMETKRALVLRIVGKGQTKWEKGQSLVEHLWYGYWQGVW